MARNDASGAPGSALFRVPRADGRHYSAIDLLRGIAALAVLFWHYQHFWFPPAGEPAVLPQLVQLPLSGIFWPFYLYGHYAVQLFWVISGFVFAAVYAGTRPSARAFFGARMARLYPLHFLTLVVVAALQLWSMQSLGYFQIYLHNDLYHFVLNVFFISDWGFQEGFSFNAPIWSVSIEVFVYIVFFLSLPVLFRLGAAGPIAATVVFAALWARGVPGVFWPCGFFFFLGSTAFCLVACGGRWTLAGIAAALASVCLAWLWAPAAVIGVPAAFAATVLAAGSLDRLHAGLVPRRLRWIGEITYSVYLLHVPCQILLMTAMALAGIDSATAARNILFFLAFMAGVIGLARLSFVYVEQPAQAWLRSRFGLRGSARATAAMIPAP